MEWIREHIGWLLPVISAVVGFIAWLLRLESRVAMNTRTITALETAHERHTADTGRHANGKAVEKLEHKIDELQKSVETKIDELQKSTRDDLRDLFNKVYDQK